MRIPALALLAALLAAAPSGAARADLSRRLFNFDEVSPQNPVVATIDGRIQIPLRELRAFRATLAAGTPADTAAQKRAVLDDLVAQYLYVDDAYRTGVAQSEGFRRTMAATRTMMLDDFLSTRALRAGAKPAPTAAADLGDRLFAAAQIDISNEAFAIVRHAADLIAAHDDREAKVRIVERAPEAVLARYGAHSLTVHQILVIYAGLPGAQRPEVRTQAGLLAMIKPLVVSDLMADEATQAGIPGDPLFQRKLIENQNALLRFHMQDEIERQAAARMRAEGGEAEVRAYYDAHRTQYGPDYEKVHGWVEGDYSVVLRDRLMAQRAVELRGAHQVKVDETILQRM